MPQVLVALALVFTTHFPPTRGNPTYAFSPASALVVYAVNGGVLYRSDDGGASFAKRGDVGARVAVDPSNAEIVYDVFGHRRSDDGGATWTAIDIPGPRLTFHPANAATVYSYGVCSLSYSEYSGVFVSYDRGGTWTHETSDCTADIAFDPLPPYAQYRASTFGGDPLRPSRQVVADARRPLRYGLTTFQRNAILVSDDNGASWKPFGLDGLAGDTINVLALDDTHLFAGTSAGLYVSTNDVPSWRQLLAGPVLGLAIAGDRLDVATPAGFYHAPLATLAPFTRGAELPPLPASVRGLAADPHARRVYATAENGVWRSDDGGASWQAIATDDPLKRGAIAVDRAGDVYAFDDLTTGTTTIADLLHYDAATGTSEHYATDLELDMQRTLWADPHRHGVLFTIHNSLLYRSDDGGRAWHRVDSFNDGTKWVFARTMTFGPPGVFYVGADEGLYRSDDDGATWSAIDGAGTWDIETAPSRRTTLYRVTVSGLSRSDDGGATWTTRAFPGGRIRVDPLNEDSVWIAGGSKLWHSADGGTTWSLAGEFAGPIADVALDADGSYVHVALSRDVTPGEWDAAIRAPRRRPSAK